MKKYKFPFYILLHPIEGFSEMKYRKGASFLVSVIIFFSFILLEIVNIQFYGLQFKFFNKNSVDFFSSFFISFSVLIIWIISNWSFSVLIDGKAHLKEIWIISCYALVPYVLTGYLNVLLSNFMIQDEGVFLSWLTTLGFCWTALLIVTALMAYQEFTIGTALFSIFISFIGMLIIIFILFLIFSLYQQVSSTLVTIFNEVMFRLR